LPGLRAAEDGGVRLGLGTPGGAHALRCLDRGQADALAGRNQTVRDVAVGGVVLGGATAFLGAVHALSSDHWSRFDKGSVTVGAAVGALSLFISWLSDHNRDELYRLINQWNLRHPDQLLAP
jgi:hypothetical protein